jgi:HD-GYP domain-containing protein (c-di-GMP phosphodiesterase class II)
MKERAALPDRARGAPAYLEVLGGVEAMPAVFPLHDEVVIGRDPQDSLDPDRFFCIPEHTVSRRHARIMRRGEIYYVEDLHSFNGTYVSGERLKPGAWRALHEGDELGISGAQIVFHSMVEPAQNNMSTIITKMVDATQFTRLIDPVPKPGSADMQHVVQKLHAMAQVSIALGAVTNRETLIEKIMNFIFELFPMAERAFILLRKDDEERPVPVAAHRRDGTAMDLAKVSMSSTIINEVLNKKHSVLSVDTLADRYFGSQHSIISQAIRSVMCVPLVLEDQCLGLIQVDTSSDPYAFKEQDLEMLTGVCAETAVALKNFQLYSDIERLLDGFVRASVQAIEERDPATAGHSFRVADFAERLAKAVDRDSGKDLGDIYFNQDQVREIRYAALLHDFGKVGVKEQVLCKEKKLYPSEMQLLEQRFRFARACLEREAYRRLVDLHARHELSISEFREAKQQIEFGLAEERERLERFFKTICHANEPAVSHTESGGGLQEILDYAFQEDNESHLGLLGQGEFAALSLPKGSLTLEERREIESHVADSYSFLILIPWTRDLSAVPSIAHGHHEKLDGSGYPMGLHGDQINVQTRILTICDIYDALTAGDRPYKKAMPVDKALDLIARECKAGHLDNRLFRTFVDAQVWLPG